MTSINQGTRQRSSKATTNARFRGHMPSWMEQAVGIEPNMYALEGRRLTTRPGLHTNATENGAGRIPRALSACARKANGADPRSQWHPELRSELLRSSCRRRSKATLSKPWLTVSGARQGRRKRKNPRSLRCPGFDLDAWWCLLDVLQLHLDQCPESLGRRNLIGSRIDHSHLLGGFTTAAIRLGRVEA